MKGIIMAGGFGTRLRPLTFSRPKPMVPLLGRPMMEHIVDLLKEHGIKDMVSLLYYLPETISDYFLDGENFGCNMDYVMAESDLGTAGSVRNATEMIDDSIIVISADVLTNFDLTEAYRFHKEKGSKATILLTRVENPLAFGIVIVDEEGRIKRFLEKPAWGQVFSDTVNTGIYILEPEVLDWIPKGQEFDFSKNLFPALLRAGEPLFGYVAPGYWRDVGNLRQYRQANADVLRGDIDLNIPGEKTHFEHSPKATVWVEDGAQIGDGARFYGRVLIGKNAVVESGSFIQNTVIGEGSVISGGARVMDSVIWENTKIGRSSQISDAIIGSDTIVGEDCTIMEHAVISDRVTIEDHAMIAAGIKIWPDKVVGRRAHVTESFIWGDRISGELFTNGRVTGRVNTDISPEFATRLGAALAANAGKGSKVAVSRDVDRASQIIERAFFCGLLASGVNVEDLGVIPIPVMRQYLHKQELGAGVHIRRSPRIKEAVDIIVVNGDGTDINNADARKIEQIFYRGDIPRAEYDELGILERPMNVWEAYSNRVQKYIDMDLLKSRKLNVVVDYRFGGSVPILQPLLNKAGIRVYPINAYVDTTRITRTREELQESLSELARVVQTIGADIGFMIDPSGERLSIVDNQGNTYDTQEESYLITRLFLETHKAHAVAFPIGATMAVSMLAREHGAKEIRTKGTHLAMMEAAMSSGVDLVGGTKGGFIFPEFGFSVDAMFALLMTLEMLAKLDKNITELRAEIPRYVRMHREVDCPWHKKGLVMRSLIEHTKDMPRDVVDGVRVITSDSWCLMVPSPEEPFFTLVAEGHTDEQATEIMERYTALVEEWQQAED